MSSGSSLVSCKFYSLRRSAICTPVPALPALPALSESLTLGPPALASHSNSHLIRSVDAQLSNVVRASELANIVKSVALVELKDSTQPAPDACLEPVVVLLPSANGAGRIFKPEEQPIQYATANGIDLAQSPFALFHQPAMVRVSPADSKQDARQVVLDLAAPLVAHIPLLQTVFAMSSIEFSFRAILPHSDAWLHSQMSLIEHRFDPNLAFLELVSMKTIQSRWKEIVLGPGAKAERVGFLFKHASKDKEKKQVKKCRRQTESHITPAINGYSSTTSEWNKSLRGKGSRRWFVLKGIFLAYFKSRDDPLPASVIPLDYYIVRLTDEYKHSERAISLEKSVPSFPKGILEDVVLAADQENENELRLWFQSTNGKCANTALNRVFGMPLLHLLCHNQFGYVKRPNLGPEDPLFVLPPFLTQCIKYLVSDGIDQEGIFRISHIAAEVLTYREYFDTGTEIDLQGTNPHLVAALIKSWLRELPDPLIPSDMYSPFLKAVSDTKDRELKTERVMQVVENLPPHNLRTLSYFANFMRQIVAHTILNRMSYTALAVVLAPCIMRQPEEIDEDCPDPYNPLQLLKETPLINEIVELIFSNSDRLAHLVEKQTRPSTSRQQVPKSMMFTRTTPTSMMNPIQLQQLTSSIASISPTKQMPVAPFSLDLSALKDSSRTRKGSGGVYRSLTEELPPLKEGQITIFTPSGVTPSVTIEPSPRSLRSASPKWGRKARNTSQWKGGAVGSHGMRSGTVSPTPESFTDSEDSARRGSVETLLTVAHAGPDRLSPSEPVSPRIGHALGYSQPASPDPEARLLSMIMQLQHTQEQLLGRVSELEDRLEQETARRTALELRLMTLNSGGGHSTPTHGHSPVLSVSNGLIQLTPV